MKSGTADVSVRFMLRVLRIAILAGGALAVTTNLASAAAITVKDATGRMVKVSDPSRIVSIGGAITEILYALGLSDRIVAVDTTSLYPEQALAEKPNVGYMRQLSPEGVLGLSPTLILASEGSGPASAIAVLEAANVPFVRVPDQFTGDGIVDKIRIVAQATDSRDRGECLASLVRSDLDTLAAQRARTTQTPNVLYVLSFINDRPMVAGADTAADSAIKLAGATNAIVDFRGYKLVNDEAIIAAKPGVVVAMQRPHQIYTAETVFARPTFAMTPAAHHRNGFLSMDGQYLLGFGPRTLRAVRDLAAHLHPEMLSDPLPSERSSHASCRP